MSENQNVLYCPLDSLQVSQNNKNQEILQNKQNYPNTENKKTTSFIKWFISWILITIILIVVVWIFAKELIINNYINSVSKLDYSITYNQKINQQNEIIPNDKKDTIEGNKKDIKDTIKNDEINIEDSNENSDPNYNVTFTATPKVSFWWKKIKFTTNNSDKKIKNYYRKFDNYMMLDSQFASDPEYAYSHWWIYDVILTVKYEDNSYSTYQDEIFIGELDQPIAAFTVKNSEWDKLTRIKTCKFLNNEWYEDIENAYFIQKNKSFTIDPSISLNTKWEVGWLRYIFEKESMSWENKANLTNQFTTSFNETGCYYIDLTVQDQNVWKQDKVRIWFNVE